MIQICKKTKKEKYYVEQYMRSNIHTLYNAYKKPSQNKIAIYDDLLRMEYEHGGMYGRIISHNSQFFTFAFKYWREVESGRGVKEILKVITPHHIYDIDLQIEYFN